ncbi:MAG TPA: hypothetical protein VF157_01820 [Chloroflexota bacterium]
MAETEEERTLVWRRSSGVSDRPVPADDRLREPVHPETYTNVNQPAGYDYGYRPAPSPVQLAVWRAQRIIYYVFGIIEAFIAIRFALRLVAANPASAFTQIIYNISWIFVFPFNNVVPNYTVGGTVFEWFSLIALLVYALVSIAVAALIGLIV